MNMKIKSLGTSCTQIYGTCDAASITEDGKIDRVSFGAIYEEGKWRLSHEANPRLHKAEEEKILAELNAPEFRIRWLSAIGHFVVNACGIIPNPERFLRGAPLEHLLVGTITGRNNAPMLTAE